MTSPLRALGVAAFCCGLVLPACFSPRDSADDTGTDAETGSPDTGTETTAAAVPTCEEYCSIVSDHCDADFAQYTSAAGCEATCAFMPPGTDEDQLGNTVGCRIHHTILAGEQPDPHCRHAGPGGEGTCGANCESFCTIALEACTGEFVVFTDAEACIADCNTFNPDPPYSAGLPDGDTLACRLKHLTFAALQPDVHCEHLGLVSAVCQ